MKKEIDRAIGRLTGRNNLGTTERIDCMIVRNAIHDSRKERRSMRSVIRELTQMVKDETTYADSCPCVKCVLIRKANKVLKDGK
jgi:hypothetical protein